MLKEELERLVAAVAAGKGTVKVLVAAIERKESELEELDVKIAETAALVQPLLFPKASSIKDYVVGSASLFTGDFTRDRQFIERVVDRVLVYESGAIVVQFKSESLFQPIKSARLMTEKATSGQPLVDQARELHQRTVGAMRETVRHFLGPKALEGATLEVIDIRPGQAGYNLSKGARWVERPPRRAAGSKNEIALASPGGFEPPLAT